MQIVQTLKEVALDKLCVTSGEALDMTANITDTAQFRAILESHAHSELGSTYVRRRIELLERLTCAYKGRHRSDIVAIGGGYGVDDQTGLPKMPDNPFEGME